MCTWWAVGEWWSCFQCFIFQRILCVRICPSKIKLWAHINKAERQLYGESWSISETRCIYICGLYSMWNLEIAGWAQDVVRSAILKSFTSKYLPLQGGWETEYYESTHRTEDQNTPCSRHPLSHITRVTRNRCCGQFIYVWLIYFMSCSIKWYDD